jgi:hypothetical protein
MNNKRTLIIFISHSLFSFYTNYNPLIIPESFHLFPCSIIIRDLMFQGILKDKFAMRMINRIDVIYSERRMII